MSAIDWSAKLAAKGVAVKPMGPGHWRTTKGARTVDYWPTTQRWRDLGLGVQGAGLRSMLSHYGKAR
jgi:hypothetical protein